MSVTEQMWTRTELLNARGQVNILRRMRGTGSERQAGLATAEADLDHYDVSLLQRDDKSSDIRHDRQRIVSERQNLIPKLAPHGV